MKPFHYVRPADVPRALEAGAVANARYAAGGTTLVDLMRLEVMQPDALVDLTGLPLAAIEVGDHAVRLGALARNSDVANHPVIAARFPALAEALLSGASPQIRNAATIAGNLLQRTRCPYFRDLAAPCNKRERGTGCAAIGGYNRSHAVLGTSSHCMATHPSDMAVALVALDAVVHIVRGAAGAAAPSARAIPVADLHTLPGATPDIESVLAHGDLITHVELPLTALAARSRYVKVRDRASFAFALASAAVALDVRGGVIAEARIALGGVATKPWRARAAETMLAGAKPGREVYRRAAEAALAGARGTAGNEFKIELARRTIVRALEQAGGTP